MSNRVDELLAALLNGETADITPQSRVEAYLKVLVDGSGTDGLPAPQSSAEAYLYALAENGMSGGGGGGGKFKITSMKNFYYGGARWEEIPIDRLDTTECVDFSFAFYECTSLVSTSKLKTGSGTDFSYMFQGCSSLISVQELDTSKGTLLINLFSRCPALTSIPKLDTSNNTKFTSMFYNCQKLTSIPELDSRKGTDFSQTFENCYALTSIPKLDVRNSGSCRNIVSNCRALTHLRLYNIKYGLTIGSGTSYGHLLTVDSLIHTIRELLSSSSAQTLTIGSANLEKLANVYVRTVGITDKMRAEDEFIDQKVPFEVCGEFDEAAQLITDYVLFKNWKLQ